MKYLVDANVWLQPIVGLAHAAEVVSMLTGVSRGLLAVTDFVLHSVAMRLTRTNPNQFRAFLDDVAELRINTLHLAAAGLHGVLTIMSKYRLDFDDAFQYFAAERFDLKIVRFDSDFDRTPRGCMTPAQVLAEIPQAG